MTETQIDYENRQVRRAYLDAMKKFDGDAFTAAHAYGDDVVRMIRNSDNTPLWIETGLIRLYTRIAVRLAADFASC